MLNGLMQLYVNQMQAQSKKELYVYFAAVRTQCNRVAYRLPTWLHLHLTYINT